MKLTVLGINGPFPAPGGACSGYLITSDSGRTRLLLDCGSGVLGRLQKECSVRDINAVVLTHLHYDHMSDMLPMNYLLQASGVQGLKVFAPKTPEKVYSILEGGALDLYEMKDAAVGEMKIEFLPVTHPVETYAVRVHCDGKVLVYTGDTNENAALSLFADGADMLVADCGLLSEDWAVRKPHVSPAICARLARDAHVSQLILTHLNPVYDVEAILDEAVPEFPGATVARAGVRVCV